MAIRTKTQTRPFPLRMTLDQLEEMRQMSNLCSYSMNQFGDMAIAGIIEMIRQPDGYVPEIVQVARLGLKMEAVKQGKGKGK